MSVTIGIYREVTLSLSDLLDFNHGKSGVTLRNRVLYPSHLRRLGGSLRLRIPNYSQTRAQGLPPPHPAFQTSCVQHSTVRRRRVGIPRVVGCGTYREGVYPPWYPEYMYREVYTHQGTGLHVQGCIYPPMVPGGMLGRHIHPMYPGGMLGRYVHPMYQGGMLGVYYPMYQGGMLGVYYSPPGFRRE